MSLTSLYVVEVALILVLFVYRMRMGPKCPTVLHRLWFQVWTLAVYVGLAGYVVPRIWLGDDYRQLAFRLLQM